MLDIKPLPPSFLGIYNLSTSDLGCNVPYIYGALDGALLLLLLLALYMEHYYYYY